MEGKAMGIISAADKALKQGAKEIKNWIFGEGDWDLKKYIPYIIVFLIIYKKI